MLGTTNHAAIQIRVLIALMIREMITRYGRSAGGYIWAILEPLATIALLTLIFSQIARHPSLGTNYPLFFASGHLAYHIYMDISRAVSSSINGNRSLLRFPRITMLDVIISRFLLQLLTSFVAFLAITVLIIFIFDLQVQFNFVFIFLSLFYAALVGLGIGSLNCVLFAFIPTWERIFRIFNRPLFLLSGIFYIYEDLPVKAQNLIWYNPLIHITATMRRGFYAEYHAAFVSPIYVLTLGLGTLMLGILLLRVLRTRVLEGPEG
jgi:capsular polysaccharide transport system permease protein